MKILLVGLVLGLAYAAGLMKSTDMVLGSLMDINSQHQTTANTAEQWSMGNTEKDFVTEN